MIDAQVNRRLGMMKEKIDKAEKVLAQKKFPDELLGSFLSDQWEPNFLFSFFSRGFKREPSRRPAEHHR